MKAQRVNRFRSFGFSAATAALLILLCSPVLSLGAEKGQAEKASKIPLSGEKVLKSNSPLHIASDRMEVSQTDKTIIFEGHVTVQQDDLTITGNRLKVNAAASGKGEKGNQSAMMDKIDRIEVEGSVKISQRDKVATADKAVYYHQEDKIVLLGSPTVSQGKDSVQGRLITLYIKEGRSVVEGGEEGPVQAVLHPKGKDQQ